MLLSDVLLYIEKLMEISSNNEIMVVYIHNLYLTINKFIINSISNLRRLSNGNNNP